MEQRTKQQFPCIAHFYKDKDWGYYVMAANLPGCISQGETMNDCRKNIVEAFSGALESYLENNMTIPWGEHRGRKSEFIREEVFWVEI